MTLEFLWYVPIRVESDHPLGHAPINCGDEAARIGDPVVARMQAAE